MKRTTVHVFNAGEIPEALSVCKYLRHHQIDAVIVTKHAVQISPDHKQEAVTEILKGYRWGWDKEQPEGDMNR